VSKPAVSNHGLAELTVHNDLGRSVVIEQYSQAPLQLHRPLYLDGEDYPTVFLKTPSAGLLGGDKHEFSLHALHNSTIKILNQSATLVYPGKSEQTIEIDIAGGATVFFEPCPLILAAGAILTQTVRINMAVGSRLKYIDEWSAGRIAMNECWRFERFDNTIEILVADVLQYRERFVLEPLKNKPDHALIGHDFTRFKSVYCFGPWQESERAALCAHGAVQTNLKAASQADLQAAIKTDGQIAVKTDEQATVQTDEHAAVKTDEQATVQFNGTHNPEENDCLAWRLTRPCGTIDRLLSMPSASATGD
jgi:urease accessory protein UreH